MLLTWSWISSPTGPQSSWIQIYYFFEETIQIYYEDVHCVFSPKSASQKHRLYFCSRQLGTSSSFSTAATLFEVQPAGSCFAYCRHSDGELVALRQEPTIKFKVQCIIS
ncbi:hypothetical protein ACQJBY_022517 [Aegilops geniculata]